MSEFDNDVILITGSASGIGKAAARLLHSRGARVAIADINLDAAQALVDELGEGSTAIQVDVSSAAQVKDAVARTVEIFGRLDVLVNNAGYGFRGTVATITEEEWERVFDVNVKSVFLASKYALPHLSASGAGRIVNTSSYTSLVGLEERAAYVATKGAITSLTRSMALDHVVDGVRVNAVAPGTVDSPYHAKLAETSGDPEAFFAELNGRAPVGRMGQPEEIAEAIAWLASRRSSYANGSILTIDGGTTAW